MKRRMTLSLVLTLSVLLTLMSSDSTARAQQEGRRFSFDTGVFTLNNPDQVLRFSIHWGDGSITPAVVRFRQMGYIEQGNIYKVASEVTTAPITLAAGEAAHIDISQGEFNAVRGEVIVGGSSADAARARVTVQIITRSTGRVDSFLPALLIP